MEYCDQIYIEKIEHHQKVLQTLYIDYYNSLYKRKTDLRAVNDNKKVKIIQINDLEESNSEKDCCSDDS